MLFILVTQMLTFDSPPLPEQARASVRIERPGLASATAWQNANRRSERFAVDDNGEPLWLRLVEFE